MPKQIRLSVDYQCWPLWWAGQSEVGEIDPGKLPLKPETADRIEKWADWFDTWMDFEDAPHGKKPDDDEFEAFEQEGIEIWKELRKELAPDYEVAYNSKKLGRLVSHPDQLFDERQLEYA